MHLVIAIPTLNRCKYLKNNIHFFDQQRRPANIRVSLAISNSASVDETESFLGELQNSRTDLFLFNKQTGYNGSNYGEAEASGNIKQTSIPNKSLETYDDVRVTYFSETNIIKNVTGIKYFENNSCNEKQKCNDKCKKASIKMYPSSIY